MPSAPNQLTVKVSGLNLGNGATLLVGEVVSTSTRASAEGALVLPARSVAVTVKS